MVEAIAPWHLYARNKERELGGLHDEYVAEYHAKSSRLFEILEERGLMKDVPTPLRRDRQTVRYPKTLVEAGFIENLSRGLKSYGLDTPVSLFHILTYDATTLEGRTEVATLMNIAVIELEELYQRVSSFFGEEYRSISDELAKFTKM